ncbi:MAG TPA: hypothetical protein VMQ76_08685 [Terracidiphilus sp.]|jgi:hypothetical protein|nr:hypothetical protein [Terracidiphilus sp.]
MAAGTSLLPMKVPAGIGRSEASAVAATSTENPTLGAPADQWMQLDLSEDDINLTVKIVGMYRNQWGPDRLARQQIWLKNVLFYRGIQVIDWIGDEQNGNWVDALSWYQGSDKVRDGESTHLQRFLHPMTLLLGQTFVGNMSREVPNTVVKPQDARILADMTTASAAQEAVGIIERRNKIRQMVRGEFEMLYLYGTYFKQTRGVLDGNWSGYDTQPVFGEISADQPDRMRCLGCGKETPAAALKIDENGAQCPGCGQQMGEESFYPAEPGAPRMGVVGMQKIPRAMVKQTIHSPLEVDCDPMANELAGTPILAFDFEIDIGEARMMFPDAWDKIHEGAEASTAQNSNYDKLRRSESYAMGTGYTTDTDQQKPTYSQVWVQPMAYNRTGDREYVARMMKAAPDGLRITMLGPEVVGVKKSVLTKVWSLGRLHENHGIYSQSIAENVTSFNERFNNAMYLYDDWMMRASCGMNLIDAAMIDSDKWKGNTLAPATVIPVPTKFGATQKTLADAFLHFEIPVNPALGMYPSMLLNFAQMLNGLPAQLTGNGTTPGVETLGGQQMQAQAGSTGMEPFWENVKEEHAQAAQNAIECLTMLLKCGAAQEIAEVVEDKGQQFRTNYVNLQKMQGRVKVYPDEDQDLPQTAQQIRESFTTLVQELTKGNPVAQAIFDVPVNQETIGSVLYPNIISPVSAQRAKTLEDLNTLLERTAEPVMQPDGSIGSKLPVEPSILENFEIVIPTITEFYIENADLRIKNPLGYSQIEQYFGLCQDMQAQQGVRKAGLDLKVKAASQPPDPNAPAQQQALGMLRSAAADMIALCERLAAIDPSQTDGSITGQVAAAGKVIDTAGKVETQLLKA